MAPIGKFYNLIFFLTSDLEVSRYVAINFSGCFFCFKRFLTIPKPKPLLQPVIKMDFIAVCVI